MTSDIKPQDIRFCRVCGAAFKKSPTDKTVNCPDHRARAASRKGSFEDYAYAYCKAGDARKAGRAAQAAGDDEAHKRHVADFQYWMARAKAAQA